MQKLDGSLLLSASDLVGHLRCRHLSRLDLALAEGKIAKPQIWDPTLEVLRERGLRHERNYIDHLVSLGLTVLPIDGSGVDDEAVARTREAMASGAAIIAQGAFRSGRWVGRTDFLQRIETPSQLGSWSYEVIDTKLARETRGATVLQLCLYADLVADVQGVRPANGYVVVPGPDYAPQVYRMDDYGAYYRHVRDRLTKALEEVDGEQTYPEPCEHCEVCRWREACDRRRRADDHLSLVAWATRLQREELLRHGIGTVAALAAMPLPLAWKPSRGAKASYERIREQARIQVAGRKKGALVYELLPPTPGFGLARLPQPSAGDVFFDLEGDPFIDPGGQEYLFGYAYRGDDGALVYTADWALSREEERSAFERFVDFVIERLEAYPDLHIYHFAPYEPAALKRLMGRYAAREDEVDSLLRAQRFIDLYGVVRTGLRASVESYSIKKLEPLYGLSRATSLDAASSALAAVQACLELGEAMLIEDCDREVVAGYNRDDCLSALGLRDWLELRRSELTESGAAVPRPETPSGEASESLTAWQQRIGPVVARLTEGVPADTKVRTPEQHARWLLAHLLDWHRREKKATWWEYFRLCDLPAEDLLDERAALSELTFLRANGVVGRSPIHRYRFPPQETEIRGGEELEIMGGGKLGSVHEICLEELWIDIKKRGDSADMHPRAVFSHKNIRDDVLAESLLRLGEHVANHGMDGDGPQRAARDLLMRAGPRVGCEPIQKKGESALKAALRVSRAMAAGIFPIQGPPGSGKTYTGARMICALVREGKKVGVTANSHKVIRNLLDEVLEAAREMGVDARCVQKLKEIVEDHPPGLCFTKDNADLIERIRGECNVAGGTAWLWARPEAANAVDVLFVDEAAQMSLANVLAVSQAAPSLVLLGDPQQLDQPTQGSHPEGTDVSALHHLLEGEQTIASDRGLFLDETWRLHPAICAYTSELFYSGRLRPGLGLEAQTIRSSSRFNGSGLRYVPVATEGARSSSPKEADVVRAIVRELLDSGSTWIDKEKRERPLTLDDILIVAPYNAQVFELWQLLPDAPIGTVDKFQGQEAPVVIYSMTTSSPADAPRGMEFLYSLNRLNVATSRAQCLVILVASPALFEPQCQTPRQMQLANAFCRYLELATTVLDKS
ncbi:MAG: TM0106 family RecB-like putative nuclease [Hyphomicrobiales bacterium]|nr:TM0106 family RecB-like putative nuclease [Hyphomicrobiales bacterium]